MSLTFSLHSRLALALIAFSCSALLAACGSKKEGSTQVAAEVNQGEISVHQINLVLQRQVDLQPDQAEAASRAALERLIQLELAVQRATETKVDRDPQVVQALDFARREVLARAYIDRLAEAAPRPSTQEIDKFYEDRPALFKNRRVYSVQEFGVDAPEQSISGLRAKLQSARTGSALLAELAASGLPYSAASVNRPAEHWPLPVLDQLAGIADGQAIFLPQPNGLRILLLNGSTPAPRSAEQARPAIEQYLLNQRKQQKVDAELTAMRSAATVKYLGKFAEASGTPNLPQTSPSAPAATAPPSSSTTSSPGTELGSDALRKGIQGLK